MKFLVHSPLHERFYVSLIRNIELHFDSTHSQNDTLPTSNPLTCSWPTILAASPKCTWYLWHIFKMFLYSIPSVGKKQVMVILLKSSGSYHTCIIKFITPWPGPRPHG